MRYDINDKKNRINGSEGGGNESNSDNNNGNNSHGSLLANKCRTLDEGTNAFFKWLNYENKQDRSSHIPIILKKFIKDKHTILFDTDLNSEIDVEIKEGVPFCKHCNLDDCSHVGFTVSLEQMCENRSSDQELSVDDIIDR
jgi:hypothetical protein